jgi:hypothetical protein
MKQQNVTQPGLPTLLLGQSILLPGLRLAYKYLASGELQSNPSLSINLVYRCGYYVFDLWLMANGLQLVGSVL